MTNFKPKLRLAIIGHGFVGKATDWGFNKRVEKFIVDPRYDTNIDELKAFNPEVIFICVPTPMSNDGSHDSSLIEGVFDELIEKCPNSIKVVKSTVLPNVLVELEKKDNKVIYNPEFLREKSANYDFVNAEMIIFGGDKNICSKVSKIYYEHSRCKTKEHIYVDLQTASFIKYSINTFLASKVIFFNELFSLYEEIGANDSWETVIHAISRDKRIGDSHMNVPGHDGRKGFGGACFPKDSLALLKFAKSLNIQLSNLEASIKKNNVIRSEYNELDKRESEQNISYDDKI